jgi:hypothetical protein
MSHTAHAKLQIGQHLRRFMNLEWALAPDKEAAALSLQFVPA